MLNKEIQYKRVEEQIKAPKIQKIIQDFQKRIEEEICETNPIAFWDCKKYEISLPYIDGFNEEKHPNKSNTYPNESTIFRILQKRNSRKFRQRIT